MYNLDPRGYPCAGAPIPLWVSTDYTAVCSLCYEMFQAAKKSDERYWETKNKFAKICVDPTHEYELTRRYQGMIPRM